MNFPSFDITSEFGYQKYYEDSTISSDKEGGYEQTRPRFTRNRLNWDGVVYIGLTDAEKAALLAFDESVKGRADAFNWVDPVSQTTHQVRFKERPKYEASSPGRWKITFSLREV